MKGILSGREKVPKKMRKRVVLIFLGKGCVFICVYWSLEEGTARDRLRPRVEKVESQEGLKK